MIFYITFLRMVATCLITNSHYTGIYPTDLIANGGLLGDVIFFAVSGYCLYNVKTNFFKWYGKRLWRVYLPVFIITFVYILLGLYNLSDRSLISWFVYPTYYHFVASIVLLYIPFYFICKIDVLKRNIPKIMLTLFAVSVMIYIFFYDRSYYHIDAVREPFIRFLFMESMLLGAWFKSNDGKMRNNTKGVIKWSLLTVLSFVVYFISKLSFQKIGSICDLQIINQIVIFAFLYCILRTFASIDFKLEKLPKWIKNIVSFLASITLEIYLVQYVLIDIIRGKFIFPLNWIVLTGFIIACAYALHIICNVIYSAVDKIFLKTKNPVD